MKKANQILTDSYQRQLTIDALIQSVVKESFDGTVIDALKIDAYAAINSLRTIEEELFGIFSIPYTKLTYPNSVGSPYMATVQLPQIQQAGDIKAYYIEKLTEVLDLMTDDEAENDFIADTTTGNVNEVTAKTGAWKTEETALLGYVSNLIDTLVADALDNS